ncbi:MAG: hypothetical protein R3F11_07025 [Verrucomicrobiales bacterium]
MEEITASTLGATPFFRDQVLAGGNRWRLGMDASLGVDSAGHAGGAIGDANGDSFDDLYVCDLGGLPNRLYLANPDGTVRDASAESGADWLDRSMGRYLRILTMTGTKT